MADALRAHAHACALTRLSSRARHHAAYPPPSPPPRTLINRLLACHVPISPGLSPHEFFRIQTALPGLSFPPDLKAFLCHALPLAPGFPDWRSANLQQLQLLLHLPIAGLSYEVARGRFWWKQWGPKPIDTEEAVNIARTALSKVPVLVPVYRHYYIPASPNLTGNPVFFVCQKYVSYCGNDLEDFFESENFFTNDDHKLPSDFTNLLPRTENFANRVSQTQRTFRLDKQSLTCAREETSQIKEGKQIEYVELQGDRKCKEYSKYLEDWGRKLDAMAVRRNVVSAYNGETERLVRSIDVFKAQQASRYCDPSLGSNIVDPVNPAGLINNKHSEKGVRRIEFWSDLAESLENTRVDCKDDHDLFSCMKVDVDLNQQAWAVKQLTGQEEYRSKQPPPTNAWLDRYLDGIATMLRTGGWKEADIAEMITTVANSAYQNASDLDRHAIWEGLVLYMKLVLDALRKAGWSSGEVADAVDADLSFVDQLKRRRPSSKLPPHVLASQNPQACDMI